MATKTALVTAEDLWHLPSNRHCELVDGVLIEMTPPGGQHGKFSLKAGARLLTFVEPRRLGVVVVETGFILRRHPDTVRSPDVAFVRAARVPRDGVPVSFWELAPDLVVEVVSPGDTATEVQAKVREWIEAGVRLVWVVYPSTRTVHVVRSLQDREELNITESLAGGDLLPGFTCPVEDLFA